MTGVAAQIHQTGHSCIALHFSSVKVGKPTAVQHSVCDLDRMMRKQTVSIGVWLSRLRGRHEDDSQIIPICYSICKSRSIRVPMSYLKFVESSLLRVAVLVCVLCLPSNPAFACIPINEPLGLSMCVAGTSWELREGDGDDFLFYNAVDEYAGSVRVFEGGTNDGLESERAARIIVRSDSQETRDFTLLKAGKVPSGNFVYAARGSLNGRTNIYVNTVSVGPTETLRITTWRIGEALSDRDRELHAAFGKLLSTGP
ncbi:hypothetical protein [Tropicimonas sp. IMCC34011]|uniref:hypothetical protein n=1 Tax=Tropicimonas sp. IMCC34011 TaxID=2248759 RepID=UPI001300AF8B|nr:hypothetical protein [Tropicimonas sp. IMCC34011]